MYVVAERLEHGNGVIGLSQVQPATLTNPPSTNDGTA